MTTRPDNLKDLKESGWKSRDVKTELRENFTKQLAESSDLFPGILGYDDTVIPEITLALLAEHDMLFLGEKGQAKSRIMRNLVSFLDEEIPYIDCESIPVHEDPLAPITQQGQAS